MRLNLEDLKLKFYQNFYQKNDISLINLLKKNLLTTNINKDIYFIGCGEKYSWIFNSNLKYFKEN
jgi:hypothetical protein